MHKQPAMKYLMTRDVKLPDISVYIKQLLKWHSYSQFSKRKIRHVSYDRWS